MMDVKYLPKTSKVTGALKTPLLPPENWNRPLKVKSLANPSTINFGQRDFVADSTSDIFLRDK